ncbi:DUF2782 domain-containing protein [Motiliproteus sp. SC1-56]|uniref:DUF2782 domain-containing protein n=1 Tax=Motiliproteus sp. SC1-56 TaxID=2799565 RepID=UPI001A90C25F|nr:DUF2782 domain-containing protein [Motiliproteus sp. SC1-56]
MTAKPLVLLFTLALALGAPLTFGANHDQPEDIRIRPGENGEVWYEYRINGEIQEIKVVPKNGKPYYLVPSEGHDGYIRLDRSQLLVPKWVLFRW